MEEDEFYEDIEEPEESMTLVFNEKGELEKAPEIVQVEKETLEIMKGFIEQNLEEFKKYAKTIKEAKK